MRERYRRRRVGVAGGGDAPGDVGAGALPLRGGCMVGAGRPGRYSTNELGFRNERVPPPVRLGAAGGGLAPLRSLVAPTATSQCRKAKQGHDLAHRAEGGVAGVLGEEGVIELTAPLCVAGGEEDEK